MKIWTIQLAKWRAARARGIPLLDTTVKSGDHAFAPSWDIVMAIKRGEIGEQEYRTHYIDILRASWKLERERWEEVLNMDEVALACYCAKGHFCHRHILKEAFINVLKTRNLPYEDCGELT